METDETKKYLTKLGLSDSETTVYLRMIEGASTAREILHVTTMKRPTVYYALDSLMKRGLVSKSGKDNDSTYSLSPFERLVAIAREKEDEAILLTEKVGEITSIFSTNKKKGSGKPTVSFFEGVDAVRHVVMDTMYAKKKQIDIIAPKDNFFWGIGGEFVKNFVTERISRGIKTRNLWEEPIKEEIYKKYYEKVSEVRTLPSVMKGNFKTTIFLFDDKTLYVSSSQGSYCILVTSKEHTDMMHAIFEGLWTNSTLHPK